MINEIHLAHLLTVVPEQFIIIGKAAEDFGFGTPINPKMMQEWGQNKKSSVPFTLFREPMRSPDNTGHYLIPSKETYAAATRRRAGEDITEQTAVIEDDVEEETVDDDAIAVSTKTELTKEEQEKRNAIRASLIPRRSSLYVPFGNHPILFTIFKSNMFAPVYITGLSGNGKTFMVEQIAARLRRPIIRVNFTIETDEDDLIGGFRLDNGRTFFEKGPVIRAMEMGAVLLLDEIDLASPARVMCLQSITEGNGYFIKKTGELVKPADGFMIVATANTKGRGDDTAKFIATNVHNEAALERFAVVLEQEYPASKVEKNIIEKFLKSYDVEDQDFVNTLVKWAEEIRKSYATEVYDEVISTRRLIHIAKMYIIFKDRHQAVKLALNRFDKNTQKVFYDLFAKLLPTKVDPQANRVQNYRDYSSASKVAA